MKFQLEANKIKKLFNRRIIFNNINFKLENGSALAITGRNGSGKSTLVKIIAGVLSPSSGLVSISINENEIKAIDTFKHIGFVSPYLQLYDEFTAVENLDIFAKVRSLNIQREFILDLLKRVNLYDRRVDFVRTYSSGMKQRLKYTFALLHRPELLILDEPRSNLDAEGISIVSEIIKEQKQKGATLIATNDSEDLLLCENVINLDDQKNNMNKH
jgi:heme exporter protein A